MRSDLFVRMSVRRVVSSFVLSVDSAEHPYRHRCYSLNETLNNFVYLHPLSNILVGLITFFPRYFGFLPHCGDNFLKGEFTFLDFILNIKLHGLYKISIKIRLKESMSSFHIFSHFQEEAKKVIKCNRPIKR